MLKFASPAKVNLFLRVLKKRDDGYHSIASLMQTVDLYDQMTFHLEEKDAIHCLHPEMPKDGRNLILKAADLFRKKTGMKFGLRVDVDKKIPIGSGLGGGSSNAATTLWALNRMHQFPVDIQELQKWASEIGSDVPFFFSSGTASCTGRGEIVRDLKPIKPSTLWIIKPKEGMSTPQVYQRVFPREEQEETLDRQIHSFYSESPIYENDLETAAFQVMPSLKTLKESLIAHGFHSVMMTGSGSSLLCFGETAPLNLPDVQSFCVKYIERKKNAWYESA